MKDLYLTSTFTNQWNISFNPLIGEALEKSNLVCYLPHRDTNQKSSREEIFNADTDAIKDSSMVLAIAMNESPNFGAEVGFAYGIGKPVLVLTEKSHTIPLICEGMVKEVIRVDDLNAIDTYIGILSEKIRKVIK